MNKNLEKSIDNIKNSRVLIRCDFNESIENENLLSTKRIDANLSIIHQLLVKGNSVVAISHHSEEERSLDEVFNYVNKNLKT